MANFQLGVLWITSFVLASLRGSAGCHPASRELHVCFNIYLERDLPFIETMLRGPQSPEYYDVRPLLDNQDLESICSDIKELQSCYSNLLRECDSYWQLNRYIRLMQVMNSTYTHLCIGSTNNVRDLIFNGACLKQSRLIIAACSKLTRFNWTSTWKHVLRMEMGPEDLCQDLDSYTTCLVGRLRKTVCGVEAGRVYGMLLDVWLEEWCNKNWVYGLSEYLYIPVTYYVDVTNRNMNDAE